MHSEWLTEDEAMPDRSCRFGGHVQVRGSSLEDVLLRLMRMFGDVVKTGLVTRSNEDRTGDLSLH